MSDNKLKTFLANGFSKDEKEGSAPSGGEASVHAENNIDILQKQLLEIKGAVAEIGVLKEQMDCMRKDLSVMGGNIKSLQEKTEAVRSNTTELKEKAIDIQGKTTALQDQTVSLKNSISAIAEPKAQVKTTTDAAEKPKVEAGNKELLNVITKIAEMREDFIKLSSGIKGKLDSMSAEEVLKSFNSYRVDIENILWDAGVAIEHFPCETADTNYQRVVETVATDDQSKNGKIAERLSEGYRMGDNIILKEKVSIYRYAEVAETTSKPVKKTKVKTEEEK